MKALNLDKDLRREITEYFITTNVTQVLQKELEDFMKKRISQTYRTLCTIHIFKETIKINQVTNQLLKSGLENKVYNQEVIENVIKRMETILKSPESKLLV